MKHVSNFTIMHFILIDAERSRLYNDPRLTLYTLHILLRIREYTVKLRHKSQQINNSICAKKMLLLNT